MSKKKGIAYGIGVGPGDPELMTLKACRLIRETQIIVVPGSEARDSAAYRIAVRTVPELKEKEVIAVKMPMSRDAALLEESHRKAADLIEDHLNAGRNVAYLTLGDPAVYSSFTYIQRILEKDGYSTEMVSGVPSFCAAAARLGISLAEKDEPIHIIPAAVCLNCVDEMSGSVVLMKAGGRLSHIRESFRLGGKEVVAVENCGMEGEKVYKSLEDISDETGYFTLMIARDIRETE